MEKNKQPIAVIITDTHLSESTVEQNHSVFSQAFELCINLGLNVIFHLGDIFTSRKGQSELVLNTFKDIIDQAAEKGINIIAIPGNHDKTQYRADSSFIYAFSGHQAFKVVGVGDLYNVENINFLFCPYYDEQLAYAEKLKEVIDVAKANKESINILLTHCAIDGVINNAGIRVKGELSKGLFNNFDTVFVGHYHNRQSFDNIVYIGSTDPRNFGEDDQKGVTIVYDDGSYDFVNLEFKPYITIDLLSSDLTLDTVNKAKEKSKEANICFRIQGEVNDLGKSLVSQLNDSGAKVEIHKEVLISDNSHLQSSQDIILSDGDIVDLFDQWSEDRKIENKEFGRKLLVGKL